MANVTWAGSDHGGDGEASRSACGLGAARQKAGRGRDWGGSGGGGVSEGM
jgi:hypothetical protein